jgi:hypothetical protein
MSGTVSKIAAERNQKALLELATKPGNGKRRFLFTSSTVHVSMAGASAKRTPDLAYPCTIANMPPFPRLSPLLQIYVRIVRHGIHDGPPTTSEYSFGILPYSSFIDRHSTFCSVNCASIHRKIGTHISKVCVRATGGTYIFICRRGGFFFRKSLTMDLWTKEQVEVSLTC